MASTRTAQVGPLMRRRAGGRMKNSMRASLPGATGVVAAAGSALCCAGARARGYRRRLGSGTLSIWAAATILPGGDRLFPGPGFRAARL